jgi:hydrogenase-4 component G
MILPETSPRIGQTYVAVLRTRFGGTIQDESWQAPDQVTLTVDLNSLPTVVKTIYYDFGGWLSVVAANDERPLNGNYALYYVLSVEGQDHNPNGAAPPEKCYMMIRAVVPPHEP